jgi:hypothetical protein
MGIEQLPGRYHSAASPVDVGGIGDIDRSVEPGRDAEGTMCGLEDAQKNAALRIWTAVALLEKWLVSD